MKSERHRELTGMAILCGVAALVGCGPTGAYADAQWVTDASGGPAVVDSGGGADASPFAPDAPSSSDGGAVDAALGRDGAAPYRHTITIDGSNDFSGSETFATTTASYTAYVSWDDSNLYIGYHGSDVSSGDQHKWLLAYFDVDPGSANGASSGETYNTQTPKFPSGFEADYYYRWEASRGIEDLKSYDSSSSSWVVTGTSVTASVDEANNYLEVAIPLSAIGNPQKIGVTIFWINETQLQEAAYGGLYADSFTDGYHQISAGVATIPIAHYLLVDLSSSAVPNDSANEKP